MVLQGAHDPCPVAPRARCPPLIVPRHTHLISLIAKSVSSYMHREYVAHQKFKPPPFGMSHGGIFYGLVGFNQGFKEEISAVEE